MILTFGYNWLNVGLSEMLATPLKEVNVEDLTLFWWSEKENIFSNDARVMFPLLSHE